MRIPDFKLRADIEKFQLSLGNLSFREIQYASQHFLRRALNSGEIQRNPICVHCGFACITEGHHYDYRRPLEVQWLCKSCHRFAHSLQPKSAILNKQLEVRF